MTSAIKCALDAEKKICSTSESAPVNVGIKNIALVGNPNVGKSVIFGLLTGKYVIVSNYPGTTIEVSQGNAIYDKSHNIIDTPGVNTFIPNSEDETVTRNILVNTKIDYAIQVGDAKNLARTIFISLQLAEMGIPYCLALNMSDEAKSLGINTDLKKLAELLSVPVIPTIAIQKQGISELIKQLRHPQPERAALIRVTYDSVIEDSIKQISGFLPETIGKHRSISIMVLSDDETILPILEKYIPKEQVDKILTIKKKTAEYFGTPISHIINQARQKIVSEIVSKVETKDDKKPDSVSQIIGKITMHPIWGIPIILIVLWILYQAVGVFGAGTLVDFLEDTVFGKYINPGAIWFFDKVMPVALISDFFVGEYGLITMALRYGFAIILPIVGIFFLIFGVLEDSGYLPRLAVMLNRLFSLVGLNGKAVLPLVLGLGCDTMATMVTRILPTKKERIIATILLALGIPCSAQLGVIMGMLGGISLIAIIWWLGTILIIMCVTGYFANKLLIGVCSDFIMEIPPIRRPVITNIIVKTFARVKWYLWEVLPVFIIGTAALWALDKTSALKVIENIFRPVITNLMGLPVEATRAFLIGFFRRDYGAAGLFDLARNGLMTQQQIVVSAITITLFVPCFAQFLMMVKERGLKASAAIAAIVFILAILTGSAINLIISLIGGGL